MKKFAALLSTVFLVLALAACGGGSESSSSNEKSSGEKEKQKTEKKEEKKTYGIGDTVEIDGVKFTLKNVSLTDERNEFAETNPKQVVKIEYEIENNAKEEIPIGGDLQVYDGTGNQVELYPLDNTMGSLQPGKKMQCVEHYGIEKGPIEIYFQPMFSLKDPAIFKADVK